MARSVSAEGRAARNVPERVGRRPTASNVPERVGRRPTASNVPELSAEGRPRGMYRGARSSCEERPWSAEFEREVHVPDLSSYCATPAVAIPNTCALRKPPGHVGLSVIRPDRRREPPTCGSSEREPKEHRRRAKSELHRDMKLLFSRLWLIPARRSLRFLLRGCVALLIAALRLAVRVRLVPGYGGFDTASGFGQRRRQRLDRKRARRGRQRRRRRFGGLQRQFGLRELAARARVRHLAASVGRVRAGSQHVRRAKYCATNHTCQTGSQ